LKKGRQATEFDAGNDLNGNTINLKVKSDEMSSGVDEDIVTLPCQMNQDLICGSDAGRLHPFDNDR
jgi:hypothetical protein